MFHVLPDQFVILCFLALLAWAACSDAVEFKIPNSISVGLLALYPVYVATATVPVDWIRGVAVAAAVFAVGVGLFARGLAGGGDVKLVSAAALWAGPQFILPMLLVMSLTGGALSVLLLGASWLQRHRITGAVDASLTAATYATPVRLPYGVAIAAGAGFVGLRLISG